MLQLIILSVGGWGHVHDAGEGAGERGVFEVSEAFGDFADGEGGIEEAVAGGGDFGVEDEAFWGGSQVGPEAAFEGADGHAGLVGEFIDAEGFVDVAVDVFDEFGKGAIGGGEGVAFTLIEAAGDAGGADDGVIVVVEGDFGGHAPLDSPSAVGDEFHLIHERLAGFPDAGVVGEEDPGDFGREDFCVGFSDKGGGRAGHEVSEGLVDVDEVVFLVLDPEEDIREGLEEGEGDLARTEGRHEFGELPKLLWRAGVRNGCGFGHERRDFGGNLGLGEGGFQNCFDDFGQKNEAKCTGSAESRLLVFFAPRTEIQGYNDNN